MSKRNQAGRRGDGAPGPERPGWLFLAAAGLIYAGALLGMWIVLAGQPDVQDLVVGSAAAVLAVGTGYLVSERGKMVPSARVADLRTLAGVPWQVVAETGQVFALAARKAAGRPVAPGALRTVPTDVGTDVRGWPAARREAVLTALMSAAPNTIVFPARGCAGVSARSTGWWPWGWPARSRRWPSCAWPSGTANPGWRRWPWCWPRCPAEARWPSRDSWSDGCDGRGAVTVTGVISVVLLVAGLVIVVGSCAGMAVLDDPLDRLHLTTPAAMLGSTGICASTSAVIPASVVVPLGAAALMAGFSRFLPRWARDLIAIAVALATTTLTLILMAASAGHPMIYWFSGWRPSGGMVIGIDCAVGPLGAGMASLAGVLASAALVYCWRYFDSAPAAATTPWS